MLGTLIGCLDRSGVIENYEFTVANGQLFAIAGSGYYVTEAGVLTTHDGGETWLDFSAPNKTNALCGNGEELYALASKAEVWHKSNNQESWKRIWSSYSFSIYAYDIDLSANGDLYITTCDEIIVLNRDGQLLRKYSQPGEDLFVRSFFADDRYFVIEGNPFFAAVVDTINNELIPWNEGFAILPEGLHGVCKIREHGERFFANHAKGIYTADGIFEPWILLNDDHRHKDFSLDYCRDLLPYRPEEDQWLVATGTGIHLMQGSEKRVTVFEDVKDGHNLILGITEFDSGYFVSFARLNNCMGVRLEKDLMDWQTLFKDTINSPKSGPDSKPINK